MPSNFDAKKSRILKQLAEPCESYNDSSPKGTIDEPIRSLIDDINNREGFVTTSSCSGRISVFLEGSRPVEKADVQANSQADTIRSSVGGKGGGSWRFVSHKPVKLCNENSEVDLHNAFGMHPKQKLPSDMESSTRYVHLKFEAMILHVLSATNTYAQEMLAAALASGFRESGAVGLSSSTQQESTPTVAVRSTGLGFDAIIGYEICEDGVQRIQSLVDESYLRILVGIANSRFRINSERIARFRDSLFRVRLSNIIDEGNQFKATVWEDPVARRERKRQEGLQRQQRQQFEKLCTKEDVLGQDVYKVHLSETSSPYPSPS
ncbi:hypothetical protein EJ05DRAFT_504948 [Pseudovirgaria hyperparasitica]|uniref:tRNA(Phe) 7-[(3-amino-3-carboxypropyl)-4-demethylwyosine(37)-N(4)]-methyltransferase n=1 Tax=Pseudovirgaria hyperparasitica TaxID=470096 RepID=A0A6A6VVM0_9PEZI|nr:uncharacterized protein EJ05DRAFT_504948 [Pseudovirgaria hyperparasitica]KAF2753297.1 hypothetical protein EJ05DRAFT_504948 [Pseudovirgaria hyperparasitica]